MSGQVPKLGLKYWKLRARKLTLHLINVAEIKVVRYSFSGSIPHTFEHKLRRHKQRFGKIATTLVLDEDENLL